MTTFDTHGFYSTTEPDDLPDTGIGNYDFILAISLFSHLPHHLWSQWLCRLCTLLKSHGFLLFTTHGITIPSTPDLRKRVEPIDQVRPGFWYRKTNETFGRLDPAHYGTSYVSQDFVTECIKQQNLGEFRHYQPKGSDAFQDFYIVEHV